MTGFCLTSTPFKKQDLPRDKEEITNAGLGRSMDVVKKWKKGKLYKFKNNNMQKDGKDIQVQCYSTNINSEYWMSRVSKHKIDKETYEKVVLYLNGSKKNSKGEWFIDDRSKRSELEVDYIEVLNKVEILDKTDFGWTLVNLEYELGKPLSTREFNEWVYPIEPYQSKESGLETSMLITLVADVPLKESTRHLNHTKAYYTSVEQLEYDYETEELTWTMSTNSDAGGNVPKFLQNATIAKTVTKDVPYFFDYIKNISS